MEASQVAFIGPDSSEAFEKAGQLRLVAVQGSAEWRLSYAHRQARKESLRSRRPNGFRTSDALNSFFPSGIDRAIIERDGVIVVMV